MLDMMQKKEFMNINILIDKVHYQLIKIKHGILKKKLDIKLLKKEQNS